LQNNDEKKNNKFIDPNESITGKISIIMNKKKINNIIINKRQIKAWEFRCACK
jgi:hypothetical protein